MSTEFAQALQRDEPAFHDYLMQHQIPADFKPDAEQTKEVLATMKRNQCRFCDRDCEAQFRCSACKVARYCDKECQTLDWEKHKTVCKWDRMIAQSLKDGQQNGHVDE